MKTLALITALAGLVVVPACGDDDPGDNEGNPAFVSTFPNTGFANRTATVALIGEDTAWTDASAVSFGDDVTVNSVMAVGATGLIVEYTATGDAALGARDVTVDADVLTGGFTLEAPITVAVEGLSAQGSLVTVVITNNDTLNPFDTSTDVDGNALLSVVTATAGVTAFVPTISGSEVSFLTGLGVNVAAGAVTFSMTSGTIVDSLSLDITARAATALDVSAQVTGTLTAFGTELYEFDPAAPTVLSLDLPVNAMNNAIYLVLDETGTFDQILNLGIFGGVTPFQDVVSDARYFVVWDGTIEGLGAGPYTLDGFSFTPDAANAVVAAENGNTVAEAQAVTLPGSATTGTFVDDADEDWYSVILGAGDDGMALAVFTAGAAGFDPAAPSDPIVAVFEADGTTLVAQSDDFVFFDNLITPALTENTYTVQIIDSDFNDGDGGPDPLAEFDVLLGLVPPAPVI